LKTQGRHSIDEDWQTGNGRWLFRRWIVMLASQAGSNGSIRGHAPVRGEQG
jgi:hypothetical protein